MEGGTILKTAIVTGASSGIGQEICSVLIKKGYKVYALGRSFQNTFDNEEQFIPITMDLLDTGKMAEIITSIRKAEEIHLLVNNAGIGYFGPHEELNPKKIHEMVCVNFETPLIITQLLLRELKKNKGTVINISSITAKKSNTYGCAYGATKAGLTSFSSSLFDEVRKYGVKVVAIHPDMTKSNFYRNADFMEGESIDTYLLPEEIASAVEMIISQRDGVVISEITLQPQRHQLGKKPKTQ